MKKLLILKLKILSRLIIWRTKPMIIGITGSIGKTSAKEALSLVLSKKFKTRSTYKNYNNEIGLPLTIIGLKSPGNNLLGWFRVFAKSWRIIICGSRKYPEVLILEMGVDHPGDMDFLCSIARPTIGIVTAVSYSHLEFFGSVGEIKKEKERLIKNLDPKGVAILNYDNELSRDMAKASKSKVLTYGLDDRADLKAQDIKYNFDKGDYELTGINFKLNFKGSIVPVFMKNAISPGAIYAALAAASCALELGMNLVDIAGYLSDFSLPKGRMNVLPGIKHSFLIDDTYNSSPEACLSALDVLGSIKIDGDAKRYAVLGDMLEIGSFTSEGHILVGAKVAEIKADYLVTVGDKSLDIDKGAKQKAFKQEHIFHFEDSISAGEFLRDRIGPGDVILLKASQGIRLEKAVKQIMSEKDRAKELLVRQDKGWY